MGTILITDVINKNIPDVIIIMQFDVTAMIYSCVSVKHQICDFRVSCTAVAMRRQY